MNRLRAVGWWLVPIVTAGALLANQPARSAGTDDPALEPIPTLDWEDPTKSMVVTLEFTGRTTATVVDTEVIADRPRAQFGNPPLLDVRVLDSNKVQLERFNEWHPLWSFNEDAAGHEHLDVLTKAKGRLIATFDRDMAAMAVREIRQDTQVASVDLTGAITEYCQANHDDVDCTVADLEVVNVGPVDPPALVLLGRPTVLKVRTVVSNNGPDSPMDGHLIRTASASPGITVTPTSTETDENAIGETEQRVRDENYTVTCAQPGAGAVTFTSTINTTHPADVDPDLTNNKRFTTVPVDCAVPVTVNIKPGGDPNTIETGVRGPDVPLAVLTTAAGEYGNPTGFDASTIDPLTARFGTRAVVLSGGGASETHQTGHLEDSYELDERTRDRDVDMLLHFKPVGTGLTRAVQEGCVKGRFNSSGTAVTFFGCGPVRVLR